MNFKDKPMMVYKNSLCLEDHLLIFRYGLCYEGHYQAIKNFNQSIVRMTILGKVLATSKEQMKLHLDIVLKQETGDAYWYDYVPITGKMMYCIPKVVTGVGLRYEANQYSTYSIQFASFSGE